MRCSQQQKEDKFRLTCIFDNFCSCQVYRCCSCWFHIVARIGFELPSTSFSGSIDYHSSWHHCPFGSRCWLSDKNSDQTYNLMVSLSCSGHHTTLNCYVVHCSTTHQWLLVVHFLKDHTYACIQICNIHSHTV